MPPGAWGLAREAIGARLPAARAGRAPRHKHMTADLEYMRGREPDLERRLACPRRLLGQARP